MIIFEPLCCHLTIPSSLSIQGLSFNAKPETHCPIKILESVYTHWTQAFCSLLGCITVLYILSLNQILSSILGLFQMCMYIVSSKTLLISCIQKPWCDSLSDTQYIIVGITDNPQLCIIQIITRLVDLSPSFSECWLSTTCSYYSFWRISPIQMGAPHCSGGRLAVK